IGLIERNATNLLRQHLAASGSDVDAGDARMSILAPAFAHDQALFAVKQETVRAVAVLAEDRDGSADRELHNAVEGRLREIDVSVPIGRWAFGERYRGRRHRLGGVLTEEQHRPQNRNRTNKVAHNREYIEI